MHGPNPPFKDAWKQSGLRQILLRVLFTQNDDKHDSEFADMETNISHLMKKSEQGVVGYY